MLIEYFWKRLQCHWSFLLNQILGYLNCNRLLPQCSTAPAKSKENEINENINQSIHQQQFLCYKQMYVERTNKQKQASISNKFAASLRLNNGILPISIFLNKCTIFWNEKWTGTINSNKVYRVRERIFSAVLLCM